MQSAELDQTVGLPTLFGADDVSLKKKQRATLNTVDFCGDDRSRQNKLTKTSDSRVP